MLTFHDLRPRDIAMEFIEAGGFDRPLDGYVHCKTCPYTILAQAVAGRYEIACEDGRHELLKEGEAFLTAANLPLRITHHGRPGQGFRMRARWLHVHFTLLGSIDVTSLLELPLRVTRQQCAPFGEIIEELLERGGRPDAGLSGLARRQELGFRALGLLCALAPLRAGAADTLRRQQRLAPALELMKERMAGRLSVAALARAAHMSPPHFHALFRRFLGRSPMQHLKYLRLSTACRLLATSGEPLKAIAAQTGFTNEFHLSRE
ncbi:MAG TPA: helix-turn-helix transcriptional regulator, partial [Candidatus Brocadiia bacterium]|nr:helix-turn-helix transcriptional regulator [Candidatus Brocadiia bacterium]